MAFYKHGRETEFELKALSHCAIFSAPSLATALRNKLLRKLYGPVTLCNSPQQLVIFLAKACWERVQDGEMRNWACARIKRVSKIARKVAGGVIHCAMALQVAAMRCEK